MENVKTVVDYQVAEIQISYRQKVKPSQMPKISCSKDAYEILWKAWDQDRISLQEQFKILLVNRAHKVFGQIELFAGGISGTIADPKLIFAPALKACASGIIISHNHPSGNLTPSQSDIDITRKIKEGGKLLEIKLLDHIIITTEKYFSFADEGML